MAKYLSVLSLLVFMAFQPVLAQKSYSKRYQTYSIKKERSVPLNQKKLYNKAQKWLNSTKNVKIVRHNDDEFIAEGEGAFIYENDVVLENIFLSKDANLRTKGTVRFKIIIKCEDAKYSVEFTEFKHEAFYNRYGKISFGELLMNDKVPLQKCFENTDWCNAVWKDIKDKSRKHVTGLWIDLQKEMK